MNMVGGNVKREISEIRILGRDGVDTSEEIEEKTPVIVRENWTRKQGTRKRGGDLHSRRSPIKK